MPTSLLFSKKVNTQTPFVPTVEQLDFIERVYLDFVKDNELKNRTWDLISGRTLKQMWDNSQNDYNVVMDKVANDDEFKTYRRTLTRDSLGDALAATATKLIYPSIFAQNQNQEIDYIVSNALKVLYKYTEDMDGHPDFTGHQKFIQVELMRKIEGTVHVQDNYINGRYEKELVPNTQIFIPNFWQPSLQKQPHLIRYQNNILYWELERLFGHLENWKYVVRGAFDQWQFTQDRKFEGWNGGATDQDKCSVLSCWYDVPVSERVNKEKPEKYFNVLISGVPMYEPDNKMKLRHGLYPLAKAINDYLHPMFYWGNSEPNKTGNDQALADSLYTLVVNKGKLNLMPPMVAMNGLNIEQDWIGFSKITHIEGDIKNFQKIPGVGEAPTATDFSLLEMVERNHRQSSKQGVTPGQDLPTNQPARTTILQEGNAAKSSQLSGLQAAFMVEAWAYLRLSNIIQFMPRKKINDLAKVTVPGVDLGNGLNGSMEILFEAPGKMSEEEEMLASADLLKQQEFSTKAGRANKKVQIDPSYLDDLNLYIVVSANPIDRKSDEIMQLIKENRYKSLYFNNPLVNQDAALRDVIRAVGDDENALMQKGQPQMPMAPGEEMNRAGDLTQKITAGLVPKTETQGSVAERI